MLPSLAEVDFGPIAEGQPVSDARGGMLRVTGAWVSGYIDTRPDGGGESGREVSSFARQDKQAGHWKETLQVYSFYFQRY